MMAALPAPPRTEGSHLARQVVVQLQATGRPTLQEIRVHERHGTVVLSGHVPTFYLKQLAQAIASSVDGVNRVCNQMIVSPTP
jgi:osmotically-inducible protein OsmY